MIHCELKYEEPLGDGASVSITFLKMATGRDFEDREVREYMDELLETC